MQDTYSAFTKPYEIRSGWHAKQPKVREPTHYSPQKAYPQQYNLGNGAGIGVLAGLTMQMIEGIPCT